MKRPTSAAELPDPAPSEDDAVGVEGKVASKKNDRQEGAGSPGLARCEPERHPDDGRPWQEVLADHVTRDTAAERWEYIEYRIADKDGSVAALRRSVPEGVVAKIKQDGLGEKLLGAFRSEVQVAVARLEGSRDVHSSTGLDSRDSGVGAGRDPDAVCETNLPDDAFIDQTNERLPSRRLYLRLAREGAFPSKKVGKKVIARWGDVRAAFEAQDAPKQPSSPTDDGLDGLRRILGLQPKGRG